jgi:hypothetical protein
MSAMPFTLYDFLTLPLAALPIVVAYWRGHHQRRAIAALTAICQLGPWLMLGLLYADHTPANAYLSLAGLSVLAALGWLGAIVWSFTAVRKDAASATSAAGPRS